MSPSDPNKHQPQPEPEREQIPDQQGESSQSSTAIDPVCGMTVTPHSWCTGPIYLVV